MLQQYSKDDLVQLMVEQYGALAAIPARTDEGAQLGSIFQAASLAGVLLQQQPVYAVILSRLASSLGADVDSFTAPFGVKRLGAVAASGPLVLGVPSSPAQTLTLPVGALVQTPSGLQFVIIADSANVNYKPLPINGYQIAPGQTSVSVTVQCVAAGSIGNVQAHQITVPFGGVGSGALAAVSTVDNPSAFTNGVDQETDTALKARFTLLVSSGRVSTKNAILGAAASVQTGLTLSLGDQVNADGSAHAAYFTLVINEIGQNVGPSAALLVAVQAAVEAVRSAGISFQVIGPTLAAVAASATFQVAAGYDKPTVVAAATTAYQNYVNNIGLDANGASTVCPFGKVYSVLYGVPGVQNVENLLLNGTAADVTAAFAHQLVAGTVTFTAA